MNQVNCINYIIRYVPQNIPASFRKKYWIVFCRRFYMCCYTCCLKKIIVNLNGLSRVSIYHIISHCFSRPKNVRSNTLSQRQPNDKLIVLWLKISAFIIFMPRRLRERRPILQCEWTTKQSVKKWCLTS